MRRLYITLNLCILQIDQSTLILIYAEQKSLLYKLLKINVKILIGFIHNLNTQKSQLLLISAN